jgi:Tol biopolymer transport system component
MPDVREVYDMVTQQTPPKPDALERQRKRQMRHTMNRKLGAFAVAAAIVGFAVLVIRASIVDDSPQARTPAGPGPSVTAPPRPDYVLDLNTGEQSDLPRPITDSLGPAQLGGRYAASPDGSSLAYVGTGAGGSLQIFIAAGSDDIDAGSDGTRIGDLNGVLVLPRQMTHDPTGVWSPAWSPDGTRIAYVGHARRDGATSIFVLDVATGEATRVIDVPTGGYAGPTFTPDGSSILYCAGSNSVPVLRTVPVAGGKSTILFGRGRGGMDDACGGSFSPDGSLVTMMGSEVGGPGATRFVANADGTQLRHIPGRESNPAGTWSPDGSRIVAAEFDNAGGIIVVDIATGTASRVADGSSAIWLDDHTLLVQA